MAGLGLTDLFKEIERTYPEQVRVFELSRNEYLIRKGDKEHYSYEILEGAIRVVHETEESEQNIRFGYKGSIMSSLPAFFDGSPSLFDFKAIRKTRVKSYSITALRKIIDGQSDYKTVYTQLLEGLVSQLMEREIDLLTISPMERYLRVLERSPQVFQEIPAMHIANYLRMTPEHLSRLRNNS